MQQAGDIEIEALKADSFGRIALMQGADGTRFVRRDLRHVPWWLRLPAWALARREARALRRVHGLPAMPHLLRWDGRVLDRSYLDGAAMHQRPPRGDARWFRDAHRLLQRLHRAGIAHNDLAKEANWLVLADGSPGSPISSSPSPGRRARAGCACCSGRTCATCSSTSARIARKH